jgi:NAD(P)-dependent dehydrogenase (short-subunit alcohol dehydrogenase family)
MLEGKVALVTGAAQGIGQAVAYCLAQNGADIAALDINLDGVTSNLPAITALGRQALALQADVTSKSQIHAAVDQTMARFGRIDILVNCAGIVVSSLIENLPEEVWDKVMAINTKSVFLITQAVIPIMKNQQSGKIVNISSQAAKVGEAGNGVYCASKAAVSMLTQVLALELAPYQVNVNAICPGYTDTVIMRQVFEKRGPIENMTPAEYETRLLTDVPLKRMARPEEIGELAAFLASDKASYITGIAITIAGGKVLF